jgi:hypothetical protein
MNAALTDQQYLVLCRMEGGNPLFVNQTAARPYAYMPQGNRYVVISMRTVRALINNGLIDQAVTDTTSGSFHYVLTSRAIEVLASK